MTRLEIEVSAKPISLLRNNPSQPRHCQNDQLLYGFVSGAFMLADGVTAVTGFTLARRIFRRFLSVIPDPSPSC